MTARLDLSHIDLVDLAQRLGGGQYRKAATGDDGPEFAGPCPCGLADHDGLRLWPKHRSGKARWWCRPTDKHGDAIDLVRHARECSFADALRYLGIDDAPPISSNGHRQALSVEALAEHYCMTPEELRSCGVAQHQDGVVFRWPGGARHIRRRIPKDGNGSRWRWENKAKGVAILWCDPESFDQWSDRILVLESEMDQIACTLVDVPAVAIGGKDMWGVDHWKLLSSFKTVIVWREDDEGDTLIQKMVKSRPTDGPVLKVAASPTLDAKDPGRMLIKLGRDVGGVAIRQAMAEASAVDDDKSAPGGRLPVPPFPVHVLPNPFRSLVEQGAASLDTPADFVGVPLLAIVAGAIGNSYVLQLKPGYTESAILWTGTIGEPGTAKTPAQRISRTPLENLQRKAKAAYDEALKTHETEHARWASQDRASRGDEPQPPRMRHFYVADATLEAIQSVHEHESGLVLIRDELLSWVRGHDAYRGGRGGDRQSWLSSWAGMPIKLDRKSGRPVYIETPAISVTGGIQPEMLPELAEEAGRNDGFLDRMLWAWPDASPLTWTEATLDGRVVADAQTALASLRSDPGAALIVELSPSAKRAYVGWHGENAEAMATTIGLARGLYAKLPAQLARLALVLHCMTYPAHPLDSLVSEATMLAAIELVEYFADHARRVLPAFGSAASQRAAGLRQRVLRVLQETDNWLNQSDLAASLGGHVPAAKLEAALESLESDGIAERRTGETGSRGGRPSKQWRVKTSKRENLENDWGRL